MTVYPTSIWQPLTDRIEQISKRPWSQTPERLPDATIFQALVDVAFHASLLTEEKRQPGFRILYCSPDDLRRYEQDDFPFRSHRLISMSSVRPYTPSELIRIAPAADHTRLIICVYTDEETASLSIWGLLDVGANWWKFIHHEDTGGRPPPNFLAITSTNPGELSFSVEGIILLVLRDGELSHPSGNPLWSGPISDYLESSRRLLYEDTLEELKTDKWDKDGDDDDYPGNFYNFFLQRILHNIRHQGHGGTVILVPQEIGVDDPRLSDRIQIKYAIDYDHAWNALVQSLIFGWRYYDLYFPLSSGKKEIDVKTFNEYDRISHNRREIEDIIQDIVKSIASLCSVDGAVVLTTKFKVLGFGGEIIATSPTLTHVMSATEQKKKISIESFGTRHRSAFRFCSSFENAVAFIVSSDGGIKAVKRHGRELLFWPDVNETGMGL